MGYKLVLVSDHPATFCRDGWIETNDWIMIAENRHEIGLLLSDTFLAIMLKDSGKKWNNQ